MIICANWFQCEWDCAFLPVASVFDGGPVTANRANANFALPSNALGEALWMNLCTWKNDFCDVRLVCDTPDWQFIFIAYQNAVFAISESDSDGLTFDVFPCLTICFWFKPDVLKSFETDVGSWRTLSMSSFACASAGDSCFWLSHSQAAFQLACLLVWISFFCSFQINICERHAIQKFSQNPCLRQACAKWQCFTTKLSQQFDNCSKSTQAKPLN